MGRVCIMIDTNLYKEGFEISRIFIFLDFCFFLYLFYHIFMENEKHPIVLKIWARGFFCGQEFKFEHRFLKLSPQGREIRSMGSFWGLKHESEV
jgi:hypothetical protein